MENEGIEWFGRLDGPLNLRLLLQPTIAAIFGYRDGVRDAVNNAPPYFWNVIHGHCQSKFVYFAKTSEPDFAAIDFPACLRVDLSGSMAAPSI
jgi:hypothetical protein